MFYLTYTESSSSVCSLISLRNLDCTISFCFHNKISLIDLIRIDDNMDESVNNVENARGSLLRHLNQISSNRWLMMKIFAVIIFFLIVFILLVA